MWWNYSLINKFNSFALSVRISCLRDHNTNKCFYFILFYYHRYHHWRNRMKLLSELLKTITNCLMKLIFYMIAFYCMIHFKQSESNLNALFVFILFTIDKYRFLFNSYKFSKVFYKLVTITCSAISFLKYVEDVTPINK